MKKFMTIVLAAALVFAVAGQASATALETSGEYRGRYWYLSDYGIAVDDTADFWDQRLRLNMTWKVSDAVKVGARADILEQVFETDRADKAEIDFDHAWAAFNLGPTTITVGKQDVSWGPGAYAKADNRYRAKIGAKFDPVSVSFAWDTFIEENNAVKESDDDNGYSLGVVVPVAGMNFGVLGFYRLNETDPAVSKDIMGIDVTATGAAGPVKFAAEVAYATGTDDYDGGADLDKTGLIAYGGAFIPAGPVNVGVEVAYAQGNDPDTSDENEGALVHDYNGPFSSFILFNNFDLNGWNSIYSLSVTDPVTGVTTTTSDVGVRNALALKASATFAATKELSFMVAGVYAQADQDNAAGDNDMGIEVDALAKYAVNENVTVQAGLGWLSAGDYFGKDVDDPMVATVHAIVTF